MDYFRFLLLFGCCLLLSLLAGCLVIPAPEHTLLEGRGQIEEADMVFLKTGETTREEVLLRFGEPDLILHQDRILVYHWSVSHGYWFVEDHYAAAGGPIAKDYLFMMEFDDQGTLNRLERTGIILTTAQARIDNWTHPGIEKASNANREIFIIDPVASSSRLDAPSGPVRFRMGEFRHLESDSSSGNLIGHKVAAFGVIVADVRTFRRPIDLVRSVLVAQLKAAGHHLVDEGPDIVINGDLMEFGVTTDLSLSSWDAVGSLDLTLHIHLWLSPADLITSRYQSKHQAKTVFGPSSEDFEQVMRDCLEDMQRQMFSDEKIRDLFESTHIK